MPIVVVEAGLQPYDIVALIPIIEGAGGRVTDWQGSSAAGGGRVVASGDRRLHEQVLAKLGLQARPTPERTRRRPRRTARGSTSRSIRISCGAPANDDLRRRRAAPAASASIAR